VIFEHSVKENRDEHVVPDRRLAPIETGFEIGAYKVPRLTKNVTIEPAEGARMRSAAEKALS
jgi:hypothetical protein